MALNFPTPTAVGHRVSFGSSQGIIDWVWNGTSWIPGTGYKCTRQEYPATATWAKPVNLLCAEVEVQGGGGGIAALAATAATQCGNASGGGGGGYAKKM